MLRSCRIHNHSYEGINKGVIVLKKRKGMGKKKKKPGDFNQMRSEEAKGEMLCQPWIWVVDNGCFITVFQVKDAGIGVLGLSKGADLALSMATFLPGIKAAVSISGSGFNSFIPLRGDGFTIPAHPYDLGRMKTNEESGFVDFSDILDDHRDPATWGSRIPVEKSLAKFLFLSGLDDKNWKSDLYCRDAVQRLHQCGQKVEFCSYSGAGHLLEPPYLPLCQSSIHKVLGVFVQWGGQWREHARAQEDAWHRIQAFFWKHLMNSDIPKSNL